MYLHKQNSSSITKIAIIIIGIFLLIRLILAQYTGLGIGESYYFRGAYEPQLAYFDQPPLFFWLSYVSMKFFGITTLGLRFPDVILFSGTTWVLYLIGRHLFNERAALFSIILFNFSALYVIDGVWFQPDAPLLFFWIVSLYLCVKLFFPQQVLNKTQELHLWLLLGLTMGLTGLSKYHVVFLIAGLVVFIITKQRRWLTHYGFYLSFIICGICFLPILIWNYQHDWASITFQGSRALAKDYTLHFDWFFRSFAGQALWLLPWIWVPIVYELIRSFRLGKTNSTYWFFFCMALFPVVFFTLATLWADLSYHFHWQSVGYMILFVPLGATIANYWNNGRSCRVKVWLIFSGVVLYGLLAVAALHLQTGFWQTNGPKRLNEIANPTMPKDMLIDPTMDGYDYTDLYSYFEQNKLFTRQNLFVGAANWLIAGKIDWALKGRLPVRSFEEQRNYHYYFDDKKYIGYDLIFITRGNEQQAEMDTKSNCSALQKLDDVNITRNGVVEMVLHLYECKNFTLNVNSVL